MIAEKVDRQVVLVCLLAIVPTLVTQKKFSDISIKDITDQADMNRSTFYLHFQSKEELLLACRWPSLMSGGAGNLAGTGHWETSRKSTVGS